MGSLSSVSQPEQTVCGCCANTVDTWPNACKFGQSAASCKSSRVPRTFVRAARRSGAAKFVSKPACTMSCTFSQRMMRSADERPSCGEARSPVIGWMRLIKFECDLRRLAKRAVSRSSLRRSSVVVASSPVIAGRMNK